MVMLLNIPSKFKIKAIKKPSQYKIEMAEIKDMRSELIISIKKPT